MEKGREAHHSPQLLPLLLFFPLLLLYPPPAGLQASPEGPDSHPLPLSPHPSSIGSLHPASRREALIDFLAALQMPEGGFVNFLSDDRISQGISNSYHVVRVLKVVGGLSSIDKEALINFVAASQLPSGALASRPWDKGPDSTGASYAVQILQALDAVDSINREALIDWVMSLYRWEDGGFNDCNGEYSGALWDAAEGLVTLYYLGELDRIDREKTVDYVMRFYRVDGERAGFVWGLSLGADGISFSAAMWGLILLDWLGGDGRVDREKIVNFVMEYYDEESGAFYHTVGGNPVTTLTDTYVCLGVLKSCNALGRVNATRTTEYILSCQGIHGGFRGSTSNFPYREENADSSDDAVRSLEMLGSLQSLEEIIEVAEPYWRGDDEPPPPTDTDQTPPSTPQEFWAGVGLVAGAATIFTVAVAWGLLTHRKRPRRRVRVVRRRRK